MKCDNNEDIKEIKGDIQEIKVNLAEHMARTKASEDRLTQVESQFIAQQDKNFDRFMLMDKQSKSFVYKVLVGFVLAGLLPFLLKILGIGG